LKPLPIKDRISVVYVERGNLDVIDGSFVVVDKNGGRTHELFPAPAGMMTLRGNLPGGGCSLASQ